MRKLFYVLALAAGLLFASEVRAHGHSVGASVFHSHAIHHPHANAFFVRGVPCGGIGASALYGSSCGIGASALYGSSFYGSSFVPSAMPYGGCGNVGASALYGSAVAPCGGVGASAFYGNAFNTFAFTGAQARVNLFAVPTNAYVRSFHANAFVPSFVNVNVNAAVGARAHHGLNLFDHKTVVKTKTVIRN